MQEPIRKTGPLGHTGPLSKTGPLRQTGALHRTGPLPPVTRADIVDGLHVLGLQAGLSVMVHSSLRSFGQVEGGAAVVVEALMEVLTPEGTLLMPSFNHGVPFEPGRTGVYDPRQTPTINGAIPGAFWRMPGVERSLDPTHPIAAWGKNARRYTEHHHRTLTMGPKSPLGLLHEDDGYGLLLGVDYRTNTFHHMVEMTTHAPCLGQRSEAYPVQLPDGRRVMGRTWGWRAGYCPINDSAVYAREMQNRALQQVAMIGACRATIFPLRSCFNVIARLLEDGFEGSPPCRRCPIRPRVVPETVPSDWDPVAQQIKADSEAWEY